VAFGQFREQAAKEPNVAPPQRDALREQARKAYQQALQIDPAYMPAYLALARLYAVDGDKERCLATYTEALRHHPKDASVWHELGMCHLRLNQTSSALQELQKASKLDPENRRFAKDYGYALGRLGRFDESLVVLTGLEGEAVAHFDVGRMAHHLGQDELCKLHLRVALAIKPDLAEARKLMDRLESPAPASDTTPVSGAIEIDPAPAK
jgi:tetratricopeptide (TPR) repeat protein